MEKKHKTFDVVIADELKPVLRQIMSKNPDIRSMLCTWDLFGNLNDADLLKACWVGHEEGATDRPDAVMGMLFVLQRVLEQLLLRGVDISVNLRERIQILATEVARLENANKRP